MSSRVLRKLHGDQDFAGELAVDDNSDVEVELSGSGGARKKQLNINRYDLLNQQSLSESEVKEDDDHETEPANAGDELGDGRDSTRRKKKKKKKKAVKSSNNRRSSEDNLEGDEVERSVREVNRILGETPTIGTDVNEQSRGPKKGILSIEHRNLNPNNEMKRMFGSKIVQSEQSKRRGRGRGHLKSTWLVSARDNWPQVGKPGLSMSFVESKNGNQYFTYEHNAHYQQIQMKFLEAVESLNPDNIVAIINIHPYHVDALIQLSDLCKLSEDMQMAAELIERALYCQECAFHPLFNVAQGNCRLDYRKQENRSLFISIYKHLTFVGQRACYRTALEFCKLLLSLDPENDPLGVVLVIDFYALRSREYAWLVKFFKDWDCWKNLSQLPNFAFSVAVAHFQLATQVSKDGKDSEYDISTADTLLQNALIMFPGVLIPLIDKCSIQPDPRVSSHSFFGLKTQTSQTPALAQLIQLYIHRNFHIWKESDMLPWLERNVNKVLDRVDSCDSFVKDSEQKRLKRYQGTPRNIYRHIILSEIKNVTATLSEDFQGPVLGFDPLPPLDSINLYVRPQRPRMYENSNAFSMFFRSLLPNFNINEPLPEGGQQLDDGEEIEGAAASGVDLRRSVTSLLDAMRDLLSNIHVPDVPNDADDDDTEEEQDERA